MSAADGLAGGVLDFYFNDQDWSVRSVVVSQHPTRLHRGELLDPSLVKRIDDRENLVTVGLTRAECASLPSAAQMAPVCRQYLVRSASPGRDGASVDPHLRCTSAVSGYELNDGDQHLGIVHDFLIDARTWKIAFLVGRSFGMRESEFLVPVSGVGQISFATRRVSIRKASHWSLVFEERNGYDRLLAA